MKAEIIAVGSELLTPDRLDTNSLFLTERLNRLGIEVTRKTVVGDDHEDVRDAFRQALGRVELVLASGGLGPTLDDLTREAVADLLEPEVGAQRNRVARHRSAVSSHGTAHGRKRIRARPWFPRAPSILENARGTAPGLWIESTGRMIVLLPGPPHELQAMFTERVEPRLARMAGGMRLIRRECASSACANRTSSSASRRSTRATATCKRPFSPAPGEIQVHLRNWSPDAAAAERMLKETGRHASAWRWAKASSPSRGSSLEDVVAQELTATAPRSPPPKVAQADCLPSASRAFPAVPRISWAAWSATAMNSRPHGRMFPPR